MAILTDLTLVPAAVESNPANNTPALDNSDMPPECRLYRYSMDDEPAECSDDEREHVEYEHLLIQLHTQGMREMR